MYNLENTIPKLPTMEELLMAVPAYSIYARYVGNFKIGSVINSPFRKDKTPSFGIFVNRNGDILWKDHATGESGGVLKFVKKILNTTSTSEAIREICKEQNFYSVSKSAPLHKPTPYTTKIAIKKKPFNSVDKDFWQQFGISESTLSTYNVSPIKFYTVDKGDGPKIGFEYTMNEPMFSFKVNNSYKIYRPLSKKTNKWRSTLTANDIQGYQQLDADGDLLIITKSLKDVMVLKEMGYNAIAPAAESVDIPDSYISDLKGRYKRIISLYDRDFAGMRGARKLLNKYKIDFKFIPKQEKSKDISDLVRDKGFDVALEVIRKIVNEECK